MRDARLNRDEIYIAAAAVAAHANGSIDGFRQRDHRFLVELFTNWVETFLCERTRPLQNTQVQRFLEALVRDGYARRTTRSAPPRYRLTRLGLMDLLSRLVNTASEPSPSQFLFVFYFITNYRARILSVVEREGRQFPPAVRLELHAVLDPSALLSREIKRLEREITRLRGRFDESNQTAKLAQSMFTSGSTLADVAAAVEKRYPYELNSVKPLSELFASIPEDLAQWEIQDGSKQRASFLWSPSLRLAESYLAELRALEKLI